MTSRLFKTTITATAGAVLGLSLFAAETAAQERPSRIWVDATGQFPAGSNEPDRGYDATNSAGFLVGYDLQFNRWAGIEADYGYTRNDHAYSTFAGLSTLRSDVHEMTGSFVARLSEARQFRPYTLVGTGVLLFDPTAEAVTIGQPAAQAKAVFLYGGGVEFELTDRLGLRAAYRGFVFDTPDFDISGLNFDRITHIAQPSVGLSYRF